LAVLAFFWHFWHYFGIFGIFLAFLTFFGIFDIFLAFFGIWSFFGICSIMQFAFKFQPYITQKNVVVTLRPAHKRLLNDIKASLNKNGPTYYNAKLAPVPTKSVPNSCPSNRAAVSIKKPAKSKGIAQKSSKLIKILENLAQRIPVDTRGSKQSTLRRRTFRF
jgi:hypothetical protein